MSVPTAMATSIRGRRSDFFTAGKLALGHLGLLQQYLPQPDSCSASKKILFDHLVGGDQKTRRRGKTDRLCRFQVEDRFKLGGSLRRYFAGLCAVQNTVNTGSGQPELVDGIEANTAFASVRTLILPEGSPPQVHDQEKY